MREIIFLILAVLGALGSLPQLRAIKHLLTYKGVSLKGTWHCKWCVMLPNKSADYENDTIIKQKGPNVWMNALNEWDDIFEGKIVGNILEGTWYSRKPGVSNRGVFMLKLKGKAQPELEGYFTGLDDEGKYLELMYGILTKR